MRRGGFATLLFLLVLGAFAAAAGRASADESVVTAPAGLRVGDPFTLVVRVDVPAGATVDLVPEAEDWGDVEVVGVLSFVREPLPEGGERVTIAAEVAAFAPGEVEFTPVVAVASADGVEVRSLPPASVRVTPTLRPGDPLELGPLPGPVSVGGTPGWAGPAAVAGAALFAFGAAFAVGFWWRRRSPAAEPPAAPQPLPLPQLEAVAKLLEENPAAGYRELAAAVRRVLEEQYRFPARALTTAELRARMEAEGVDRWQARLVVGLLEEGDAVVYAGYSPAPERRQADLSMAAEILAAAEAP